tara:strand:- start:189 stop:965 length:777 start_codon:yes stop_codon:yes gene_type:complete
MKILPLIIKIPFLKRLIPSLVRRIYMLIGKFNINYNFRGVHLTLDIRDSLDRKILFSNEYEDQQLSFLYANLKKFNVTHFIDVGANIGIYSLLIANKFNNIQIHSFEPHLGAFRRFKKNIEQNNFGKNIQVLNQGLSEKKGLMFIEGPKNFGINQSGGAALQSKGSNQVDVSTGDAEINIADKNIAIKIDVEGHELKTLMGFKNIFKSNNIFLQIEIFDENYDDTINLLNEFNFKLIKKISYDHNDTTNDYYLSNFKI